jgi:hypothetical protein
VDIDTSKALPLLDLSEAAILKDVKFRWNKPNIQWITTALGTAKSEHLRHVTIRSSASFVDPIEETVRRAWQDLDHLLIRLWTSRSVRPEIEYEEKKEGNGLGQVTPSLLPELTGRGVVNALNRTALSSL